MKRIIGRVSVLSVAFLGATSFASAQDWLTPRPMAPTPPPQQQQQRPQQQQQQQQQQRPQQQAQPQRTQSQPGQAQQQSAGQPQVAPQQAGPELTQVFADWRIACVSKPGRACQITQRQVNTQNNSLILMVELTIAAQPKPRNILSVVTPLGSRLSPALAIQGDGSEVASAPLLACLNTGCVHTGDIAQKNVESFRRAKSLSTRLSDLKGQSTNLVISTNGLDDAFQRVSAYMKGG